MTDRRINFTKEDIGAELLPILTTGLYKDSLDALREYIQNAIDAETDRIEIFIDPDTVSITDYGKGMDAEAARRAIRLGISDKNPLNNVGFRGIGIYSAFNLCDQLEIFTKSATSDTGYRLFFDFARVRYELALDAERRKQGKEPELYLERVLEDAVFVDVDTQGAIEHHGTMIVMSRLLPDVYTRLNDWSYVEDYLQNVVPLPFNPSFRWGSLIKDRFDQKDYRVVPVTLQIASRKQELYRPYTNNIFRHGGQHPPEFFDVKSKDNKRVFGFAWICVNDARETIKNREVRGLLIKKFGFSIANRQYLEPYFGRTVYSRRITGELIITDPNLIPNAARNDFETGSARQIFLESLPLFTRHVDSWANDIQENDRAREVAAGLLQRLAEINESLLAVQRDRERLLVLNVELADIQKQLSTQAKRLEKIHPELLSRVRELLTGSQRFVREALLSQRRARQRTESEIAQVIQRESLGPTAEERDQAASVPQTLVAVFEAFDLLESSEMQRIIQFIDTSVLQAYLSEEDYSRAIRELRDYLEANA